MAVIVVFDDDVYNLARTRELIEQMGPQDSSREIYEASDLKQLMDTIASTHHVDILVSDVMMPEGQPSGIDVVQRLFPPTSGTQVIYVSGFLGQATEVYRTEHVYFLLKPLDPDKLRDALERAYAALPESHVSMLRIGCGRKERLVNPIAIQYLESNLHKVSVHCGPTTYTTYAKLDDLQAQLPQSFSRCHRSFLVNLAFVRSLEEGELILQDGTSVPVSRRRARDVQHDLLAYLAGR